MGSHRPLPPQPRIQANKSLGQHFLIDPEVVDRIVTSQAIDPRHDTIMEVGPGTGILTSAILSHLAPERLILIERDQRFIPLLKDLASRLKTTTAVTILSADALQIDEAELIAEGSSSGKIAIIANLPYNIGTELIFKWFARPQLFSSITVMLQREVARRLGAKPRTKEYGWISVLAQTLCQVSMVIDRIDPRAFRPAPKVFSAVVELIPYPSTSVTSPSSDLLQTMALICRCAFGHRRKMLSNSLAHTYPHIPWNDHYATMGISQQMRPEEVSVGQWQELARLVPLGQLVGDGKEKRHDHFLKLRK